MQYILFEDEHFVDFLPLTYTRPLAHARLGIDTLLEKWCRALGNNVVCWIRSPLDILWQQPNLEPEAIWINAQFLPDENFLASMLPGLAPETAIFTIHNTLIACRTRFPLRFNPANQIILPNELSPSYLPESPPALTRVQDLFLNNNEWIRKDFARITQGRRSMHVVDKYSRIYEPEQVFIEPGAKLKACILDAESGPIYIGAGAEILHDAIIIGAHAIGANTSIMPGAKLRGDSSIGPYCKIGGEVANSIFFGYSNKSHDGYVGNSIIGEWCNLGAGTNVSNLKNNYSTVKVYNYATESLNDTGLQFCGLTMGDFSRCAIGTLFNTGTNIGVAANVFGAGFPAKFIPSFTWGGVDTQQSFLPEKVIQMLQAVFARRNHSVSPALVTYLHTLFTLTEKQRENANFK